MSTLPFFRRPSPLSLLHAAGTSALLVTNLTNIRYLTGVQASAGIALVLPKRIELFLDGRYHEAASRIVTLPVILRPVEELNETLRSLKRTAYECDDVTVARLLNWQRKFKNTKFVQTSGIVEEFRRTKQKEELECILRACSITKAGRPKSIMALSAARIVRPPLKTSSHKITGKSSTVGKSDWLTLTGDSLRSKSSR
jgi:Xaa-Pro aminopeptidase